MSEASEASEALKRAVQRYAEHCADADGVAQTRVPGLRMIRACRPIGPMRSVYRPLVCLVLQGAKLLTAGQDERIISAGESIVVGAHLPVVGRIVEATPVAPYLAVAIELDMALLHELALEMGEMPIAMRVEVPVFSESLDDTVVNCASRMMRLIDHPEAIGPLHSAIMRELHYWLLKSRHGASLRQLSLPAGEPQRLTKAIDLMRANFREAISVDRLADAANLSPSAFRRQFKRLTSLSPIQFQKQLRLSEARRLMMSKGLSANQAAVEVGYQSPSHFSRDYVKMFGAPPRRDRVSRGEYQAAA